MARKRKARRMFSRDERRAARELLAGNPVPQFQLDHAMIAREGLLTLHAIAEAYLQIIDEPHAYGHELELRGAIERHMSRIETGSESGFNAERAQAWVDVHEDRDEAQLELEAIATDVEHELGHPIGPPVRKVA